MFSSRTEDELLLRLTELGFGPELSQRALQTGCDNLQELIDWCLSQENAGQQLEEESSSLDEHQPHEPLPPPADTSTASPLSRPVASMGLPSPSERLSSSANRHHFAAEAQAESQRQFRENEARRLQADARKRKQLKEEARRRALEAIKDDRERMNVRTGKSSRPARESPVVRAAGSKMATAGKPVRGGMGAADRNTTTRLRIQLPGGQTYSNTFQASDSLELVVSAVCTQHTSLDPADVSILQPFPHRTFGKDDMAKSLRSLGLAPCTKLVLERTSKCGSQAVAPAAPPVAHAAPVDQDMEEEGNVNEAGVDDGDNDDDGDFEDDDDDGHNHALLGQHVWGAGHQLADANAEPMEGVEAADDNADQANQEHQHGGPAFGQPAAIQHNVPPHFAAPPAAAGAAGHRMPLPHPPHPIAGDFINFGIGARFPGHGPAHPGPPMGPRPVRPGMPPNGVFGPRHRMPMHFGVHARAPFDGQGHQLGGKPSGPNMENQPPAAMAASRRVNLQAPCVMAAGGAPPPHDNVLVGTSEVKSLSSLATAAAVRYLPQVIIRRPAYRCKVTSHAAKQLLVELQRKGVLTKKLLLTFCGKNVRQLHLDNYQYATNDFLSAISKFTALSFLSLHGCQLITDSGLTVLKNIPTLNYLSLGGCQNLLTRPDSVEAFRNLTQLTSLVLDSCPSVSDEKLIRLLAYLPSLTNLSLCGTEVTSRSLQAISQSHPGIQVLYLSSTKVHSLAGIELLSQLRALHLSSCRLDASTLALLGSLSNLCDLSLLHVPVEAQCLANVLKSLSLQKLEMPDAECTTASGVELLRNLAGLSLEEIDLRTVKSVCDAGLCAMADGSASDTIQSLVLDNSKLVTDTGASALKELSNLIQLSLKNTSITDACLESFSELPFLTILNLAHTGITDDCLTDRTVNKLERLVVLDLSFTFVSNLGLRKLELADLETLNICHTICYTGTQSYNFKGCPRLETILNTDLQYRQLPEPQQNE
eukprot:scpid29301/ scgid9148/ UBX domain-containing protein 4